MGESVLGPRRMLTSVVRQEVVRERTVTVPERTGGRIRKTRSYTGIVEPGPNAPKLIRLIRTPVGQELARPVRQKDASSRSDTEWMKPESAKLVREALSGRERQPWARPTREPTGILTQPRPSADAWLDGQNS